MHLHYLLSLFYFYILLFFNDLFLLLFLSRRLLLPLSFPPFPSFFSNLVPLPSGAAPRVSPFSVVSAFPRVSLFSHSIAMLHPAMLCIVSWLFVFDWLGVPVWSWIAMSVSVYLWLSPAGLLLRSLFGVLSDGAIWDLSFFFGAIHYLW